MYEIYCEIRDSQGYKDADIAKATGITKSTFSDWKNKRSEPKLEKLQKIATYFGVTLEYLMTGEEGSAIKSDPNYIGKYNVEKLKKIPILGYISAGLPLFADEHIEGYTYTDLNGGATYFGLKVKGDSMNAARICDGDVIIIRQQPTVENGEIAVVMVDKEDATVKEFHQNGLTVTLAPRSTNPEHQLQIYNCKETEIKVLGKVVRVEIII